ncbi:hypothetical protein IWZ03DRAFT_414148 [Phyllosticta citriasiana]|uniref:Uncharacterized protein n=1 Tax=Phyllosticta citriasiana TaxID=595635 RepID=A0ABR1KVC7_9PEZI
MASSDVHACCTTHSPEPLIRTHLKEFRDIVRRILDLNAYGERSEVAMLVAKEALNVLVHLDPNTAAFSAALDPFRQLLCRMDQELPAPGTKKLTMMKLHAEFARKHRSNLEKVALESLAKELDRNVFQEAKTDRERQEHSEAVEQGQRGETKNQNHSRSSSDDTITDSSQVSGQSKPMDNLKIKMNPRTEPLGDLKLREKNVIRAKLQERPRKALRRVEIGDDWVCLLVKWSEEGGKEE